MTYFAAKLEDQSGQPTLPWHPLSFGDKSQPALCQYVQSDLFRLAACLAQRQLRQLCDEGLHRHRPHLFVAALYAHEAWSSTRLNETSGNPQHEHWLLHRLYITFVDGSDGV